MGDAKVGTVVHFYDKISVAIIKLDKAVKVGDNLKFKYGEEELDHTIESMQIDHKDIQSAKKGDEVGVKVSQAVKENTQVYLSS